MEMIRIAQRERDVLAGGSFQVLMVAQLLDGAIPGRSLDFLCSNWSFRIESGGQLRRAGWWPEESRPL